MYSLIGWKSHFEKLKPIRENQMRAIPVVKVEYIIVDNGKVVKAAKTYNSIDEIITRLPELKTQFKIFFEGGEVFEGEFIPPIKGLKQHVSNLIEFRLSQLSGKAKEELNHFAMTHDVGFADYIG
jgi:hypothetical protein